MVVHIAAAVHACLPPLGLASADALYRVIPACRANQARTIRIPGDAIEPINKMNPTGRRMEAKGPRKLRHPRRSDELQGFLE
jgi:DNA-directed RNA polymerase sigma subunit (sigma70/sigma32)